MYVFLRIIKLKFHTR